QQEWSFLHKNPKQSLLNSKQHRELCNEFFHKFWLTIDQLFSNILSRFSDSEKLKLALDSNDLNSTDSSRFTWFTLNELFSLCVEHIPLASSDYLYSIISTTNSLLYF